MNYKRIAMISYHACPLAAEEGKETGGMNVYVLELSKVLAKYGYEIDIYTRKQDDNNPEIVQIQPNLRLIHLIAGTSHLEKKKLSENIPQFINNYFSFTKKNRLEYDLFYAHYYLSGLIGLEIIKEKPLIISFHTVGLMKNLVARDEFERAEIERIDAEKLLTIRADKVIASSENEMYYLQYLYNTSPEKITVISPGVDTGLFKPEDKLQAKKIIGADLDHKIILFVGRIEPLKGIDMLMYAIKISMSKNPQVKICLWIVGGDVSQKPEMWSKQLQYLEQLRKILDITSSVKFVGQKKQHQLPDYYNAADLVVMPSHYEGFGITAIEAMACGTPVITTNVSGVSRFFDKEHQELITSVNNPLLLADQIGNLLSDKKLYEQISKNLLEKVKDLTWDKSAKKLLDYLTKV